MALLTVSTARTYTRELAQDEQGVVDNATVLSLLNEATMAWLSETDERLYAYPENELGAGIGNQVYSFDTGTDVAEVLYVMQTTTLQTYGTPLERIEIDEMFRLLNEDTTQSLTLKRWAAYRPQIPGVSPGTIRVLVHITELVRKLYHAKEALRGELKREPTVVEIAAQMDIRVH